MFSDLNKNGFRCIPQVKGSPLVGYKQSEWSWTEDDFVSWDEAHSDCDVALVTGHNNVYALDIDCAQEQIATKLDRFIRRYHPTMPIRYCNPPKFTVIFRADEEMAATVGNGSSDVYKLPGADSSPIQIEVCGNNKPITIYGTHRKTGNHYRWTKRGLSPLNLLTTALPILSLDEVQVILDLFNEAAAKREDWEFVREQKLSGRRTPTTVDDTLDPMESSRLETSYSDTEAKQWCANQPMDNRDDWLKVGFALHNHYNGQMDGLHYWDELSKQYEGYEDGACEHAWEYMEDDGGVTMDAVVATVKKDVGKEANDVLTGLLDDLVLIESDSLIGIRNRSTAESVLKVKDAKLKWANVTYRATDGQGKVSYKPVFNEWLKHKDRVTVHDKIFIPSRERILTDLGEGRHESYWNMYVHPEHQLLEIPDQSMIKIFTTHIKNIFDQEGDADWVFDWMADMVQRPEIRPTVTPLHINQNTRTGRGWVSQFVQRLVGVQNTDEVKLKDIGHAGGKNGFMNNTLFVAMHEVRADGKSRYSLSDALKTLLTETHMNVDIKYGSQGMQEVYTRFLLMSNHLDALALEENDARINVFRSEATPQPPEYYARLYTALKTPGFMDSCFTWLMNRQYDVSGMTVVRRNKARADLISHCRSLTQKAMHAARQAVGSHTFTIDALLGYISTYMTLHSVGDADSSEAEINFLLADHIRSSDVTKINGKLTKVASFEHAIDLDTIPLSNQILTEWY